MIFNDRVQAAHLLAKRLDMLKPTHPLVLGIPRGGVVLADVLARALKGEVDVVLVHKLGAPGQPEYAIGAIDEAGQVYLAGAVARWGIPASYIKEESRQQLDVIKRRRLLYTPHRAPIDPASRTVIVTDDGLATGATMMAALKYVRARKPKTLVAAIPVAAPDSLEKVKELADEVVCLDAPDDFQAVGQFYYDFSQVSDDEVIALLRGEAA